MHFIYLHGFASSPRSTKAVFFSERLTRLGHAVDLLDLEESDFEGLTITRQLAVVRRAIARTSGELASSALQWARVFALALSSALVACSGDSDSDSGDDGTGGRGNEYKAMPHTTCPEMSTPADADTLFARHEGSYGFIPGIDACGMDDAHVTVDQRYTVTIRAAPKEIVVATDAGDWTFSWDGTYDLACESEFTSLVEVGSESGFARAAFVGDEPAIFLFGLCIGDFTL